MTTLSPSDNLDLEIRRFSPSTVTVVTDENVDAAVMHLFSGCKALEAANKVVLSPGEDNKNIQSSIKIWEALEESGATRKSLVVNIGGGLVTDIGGFAAATYKRGIRFINVPTTLLGAVDAATGGKTAINFNGLKNEIGAFHLPSAVIISSLPLATLPRREMLSGYAEMLKTGLIADASLYKSLMDIDAILEDDTRLEEAMKRCVEIKEEIVAQDPTEKGLRKVLNFGHTAGHAFESFAFHHRMSLTHGEAVAHGMLVELILSHIILGMDSSHIYNYADNILKVYYPRIPMECRDIPQYIGFMAHDKKNETTGAPNFTLLDLPGNPQIDCTPAIKEIETALDIYHDIMG